MCSDKEASLCVGTYVCRVLVQSSHVHKDCVFDRYKTGLPECVTLTLRLKHNASSTDLTNWPITWANNYLTVYTKLTCRVPMLFSKHCYKMQRYYLPYRHSTQRATRLTEALNERDVLNPRTRYIRIYTENNTRNKILYTGIVPVSTD